MPTILVIDDEAIVREPIAASLRAGGYSVDCACDAAAALDLIKNKTPDVILLDIRMPQRDGIALLKELRAIPATAATPVLLLSSTTERATIMEAAKLGIHGYMVKSAFSLPDLLARVQTLATPPKVPAA